MRALTPDVRGRWRKAPPKSPGVERCAGADHIDRTSRPAPREVLGEDIERTRRHQTDAWKSTHLDMPATSSQIARLACVRSRRTRSGMSTERHNEDVFWFDGSQGPPANLARLEHGQRMTEIESFALGVTLGSVINRQAGD